MATLIVFATRRDQVDALVVVEEAEEVADLLNQGGYVALHQQKDGEARPIWVNSAAVHYIEPA